MTTCPRCNGQGILSIRRGDDSIDCPACLGTGQDLDAMVAEYAHMFRFPFLISVKNNADRHELESLKDTIWYQQGLYEALGYDRHMRTYRLVDEDIDAALEVKRRQEANESYDFWHKR